MKKTRFNLIAASLVAGLALGGGMLAHAGDDTGKHPHCGHHGGHHGMGGPMMEVFKQLDLSEAQKKTVHELMKNGHENMRSQGDAMRAQHRAFLTAIPGTAGYQQQVNQMADAAADAARSHVQAMAELHGKIYAVLTPEQQARLPGILAKLPAPDGPEG